MQEKEKLWLIATLRFSSPLSTSQNHSLNYANAKYNSMETGVWKSTYNNPFQDLHDINWTIFLYSI